MAGITDIMIKTHGTPNPWVIPLDRNHLTCALTNRGCWQSICAAMEKALQKMTSPQEMSMIRGMRVHDISEKMKL